jgi:hypothetical protein
MDVDVELRKLLAEREITRLLFAYHEAINRGRFEELADLFEFATYQTAYARTAEAHGTQQGDSVVTNWQSMVHLYDGLPRVHYITTNVVVTVDDSLTTASSYSYYVGFQALSDYYDATSEDFPLQAITAGRYEDTFEVLDGRWRLRSRQIWADLSGDLSRHMKMLPGDYRRLVEESPGD